MSEIAPFAVICFSARPSNARYSILIATSQDAKQLGSHQSLEVDDMLGGIFVDAVMQFM